MPRIPSPKMPKKVFFLLALLALTTLVSSSTVAQTFTVISTFSSTVDPLAPFVQDQDGSLLGTSEFGGSSNLGNVFDVTLGGTITSLYSFSQSNGATPDPEGQILALDGNYYGVTYANGSSYQGSIYQMTRAGSLATLYSFTGGADGANPYGAPAYGLDGNYYGTTYLGGAHSEGTAYRITPQGAFTTIYTFGGTGSLGTRPVGALVLGTDGNFYGTTSEGGHLNQGTVFKLSPGGKYKTLFQFAGGEDPATGLVLGPDGNFYGTVLQHKGDGIVYRITPTGTFTTLHTFTGTDGIDPNGLILASDGNLYGYTTYGGSNGYGTFFQVTTAGAFSVVYNFQFTQTPIFETIVQHTNGLFYGGLSAIEPDGDSAIFSLDTGLSPFVRIVFPTAAVGKTIEMLGQGFTGTSAVSFNGTPATTFAVVSDTFLTAVVPTGATSGPVTVTTPSGTLTSIQNFNTK